MVDGRCLFGGIMRSNISVGLAALVAGLIGASTALTVPAMAEDAHAQNCGAVKTVGGLTPAPAVFVGADASFTSPFLAAAQLAAPPVQVAAPVPVGPPPVDTTTGPSPWTGEKLRHPDGSAFPKQISRWANIVVAVMEEHKVPRKYLPGILAQIQQESFGDPKLVNTYDSNAAMGDPSKGLLQVIGSTYQTHAKPGFKNLKYQTVPYTNIWAALRYVKKSYGMDKFASWNSGSNSAY